LIDPETQQFALDVLQRVAVVAEVPSPCLLHIFEDAPSLFQLGDRVRAVKIEVHLHPSIVAVAGGLPLSYFELPTENAD
jgi:hypothetical protein